MNPRHSALLAFGGVAIFIAGCGGDSTPSVPCAGTEKVVRAAATPTTTMIYGTVTSVTSSGSSGTIVITGTWSPTGGTTVSYNSSTIIDPIPSASPLPVVGNTIAVTGPYTANGAGLLTTMTAQNISTYTTKTPPLSDNVFGMVTSETNANTYVVTTGVGTTPYTSTVVLNSKHDGSATPVVGDEVTVVTGYGALGRALNADSVTIAAAPQAIPAPATGAYFGAWVNPGDGGGASPAQLVAETHAFETAIPDSGKSYTMALHMHYFNWNLLQTAVQPGSGEDASLSDDVTYGRVPVISWRCGDQLTNVANGVDDTTILDPTATALKNFAKPVFVRFYWEFNLAPGTNDQDCFTSGSTIAQEQTQFIAAWEHIWYRLTVTDGVSNVSWLWCPDGNKSSVASGNLPGFFPAGYVNWIGFDSYDKSDTGFGAATAPFVNMVQNNAVFEPLPIMIAETAEEATPVPAASPVYTQANYINDAYTALSTGALPTASPAANYSQVKAFMYYDAPGAPNPQTSPEVSFGWTVTPATPQFTALGNLATSSFFNQLFP